jgi:hypothetical protein
MGNTYDISSELETFIRRKYKNCIYCGIKLKNSKKNYRNKATIEHIDNIVRHRTKDNLAMCCNSCNASKGKLPLRVWLETDYCKKKKVKSKMAPIVKRFLRKHKSK